MSLVEGFAFFNISLIPDTRHQYFSSRLSFTNKYMTSKENVQFNFQFKNNGLKGPPHWIYLWECLKYYWNKSIMKYRLSSKQIIVLLWTFHDKFLGPIKWDNIDLSVLECERLPYKMKDKNSYFLKGFSDFFLRNQLLIGNYQFYFKTGFCLFFDFERVEVWIVFRRMKQRDKRIDWLVRFRPVSPLSFHLYWYLFIYSEFDSWQQKTIECMVVLDNETIVLKYLFARSHLMLDMDENGLAGEKCPCMSFTHWKHQLI